jgi:predicted Rossmann-fold nucleotide-binding protein
MTVVIYGSSYWKKVINLELLAEKGAIAIADLELFQFADTPEEAFALLKAGLTENHLESEYEREQRRLENEVIPTEPAPSAQEMLGPDITKTR